MRILYVTTIGSTMVFFRKFIKELLQQGHTVEIATNESDVSKVPDCYREWGCVIHQISTSRSPFNKGNLVAIKQIKKLVEEKKYDIVHCHTPIAAMCTRIACRKARKQGTKVFYTAHGFHFFKGAPLKNWLLYYPVEKICAHFTDLLITINKEDYVFAQKKLKAKRIEYVPGVGIDLERFTNCNVNREEKRKELDIPNDAILLLSVGELNQNKNHQVIIRALAKIKNPNIHYAIAGKGNNKDYLIELSRELGIADQVHVLGYRKDIPQINHCADAFCFPSRREGLGMGAIEAMACGLPIITSNVHGINDYSIDGVTGYKCDPNDVDGFKDCIEKLLSNSEHINEIKNYNIEKAKDYDIVKIKKIMHQLYAII